MPRHVPREDQAQVLAFSFMRSLSIALRLLALEAFRGCGGASVPPPWTCSEPLRTVAASANLGSANLGSDSLGSDRLGSASLGSDSLGSDSLGLAILELDSLRLAEMRVLTLLARGALPRSGCLPMRCRMVIAASSGGLCGEAGSLEAAACQR